MRFNLVFWHTLRLQERRLEREAQRTQPPRRLEREEVAAVNAQVASAEEVELCTFGNGRGRERPLRRGGAQRVEGRIHRAQPLSSLAVSMREQLALFRERRTSGISLLHPTGDVHDEPVQRAAHLM